MAALLIIVRVALGGTFLASGLAKIATPGQTAAAGRALGMPTAAAVVVGYLLAPLEAVCGAGLILPALAPWAAACSAVLLASFSAAILANLLAGRRPSCGCFGSASAHAIGWPTLTRNLTLLAADCLLLVAYAIGHGPCTIGCYAAAWRDRGVALGTAVAAQALAIVVLTWLVIRLVQQAGRVQLRLAELESAADNSSLSPPGSTVDIPGYALTRLPDNAAEWLDRAGAGVMIFVASGCAACDQLVAELDDDVTLSSSPILLVSMGATSTVSRVNPMINDDSGEIWQALRVRYSPTAILFGAGHSERRRAQGLPDVLKLLREITSKSPAEIQQNGSHND